jgi:hypothetical protein
MNLTNPAGPQDGKSHCHVFLVGLRQFFAKIVLSAADVGRNRRPLWDERERSQCLIRNLEKSLRRHATSSYSGWVLAPVM